MTKKSKITITILSVLMVFLAGISLMVLANSCPNNTEAKETEATLVGEVTDDGGDSNLEVWFQYGKTTSYGYETAHSSQSGTGVFCATVYNLEPCTTYHYRAVAKNSAGTSYGEDKSFTTKCSVIVDVKANDSNGPITLKYKDYVTISWTSQNADSCTTSGDWSGSKSISGSETIQLNQIKTYTFTLTCKNNNTGKTESDSVQVIVQPKPPTVITKPAIVTL
ncbi:MAG: hypothetical protein QME57_03645 [Patescibacteria group bacterium]|nr:hypothetical protein [Patescibacteria group bacterium]